MSRQAPRQLNNTEEEEEEEEEEEVKAQRYIGGQSYVARQHQQSIYERPFQWPQKKTLRRINLELPAIDPAEGKSSFYP